MNVVLGWRAITRIRWAETMIDPEEQATLRPRGAYSPAQALGAAALIQMHRKGLRHFEISWIVEDNRSSRHVAESSGAKLARHYRLYERPLGASQR